jgi:hypothetical protein
MPLPLPQPAQPAPQQPSTPAEIEILIGRLTTAAVGALAAAVQEFKNGGAEPGTKLAAGDRIAELVLLKQATQGEVSDFDTAARLHGLRLLRQHCGADATEGLLGMLVDDVLRLVDRVTRTQWH